ncbi:ABC-type oligopeptide transport system substrate-binding subunit [Mycolicibacterium iranicum]|uniref:ABC-type oligopeptide transport system substrate-binding subunit n=1 Tax=Mycolicibacterium iranicum TaxID=912594 RepID=A0A839QC02_MYCIR|nr:hypothetical protein [Mycolicibacterium iranicum]MBB2993658.1 ABC-type oligopeptide transport system substrate-binding subunit [Mycolicibacterium iranicum]
MGDSRQKPITLRNVIATIAGFTGLMLITACSTSDTSTGSTSANASPTVPAATAAPGGTVAPATTEAVSTRYAQQIETAVLDGLMDNDYNRPAAFKDMCTTVVVWACAIGKIESDDPGSVNITLAPESVWIGKWEGSTDWYDFGEHVARGVYNFTQGVQPPLTQIDVLTSTGDIAYLGNY